MKLREAIPAGRDRRVGFQGGRFEIFQGDIRGRGGGPIFEVGCHFVLCSAGRPIASGHVRWGKDLDLHAPIGKGKHLGRYRVLRQSIEGNWTVRSSSEV